MKTKTNKKKFLAIILVSLSFLIIISSMAIITSSKRKTKKTSVIKMIPSVLSLSRSKRKRNRLRQVRVSGLWTGEEGSTGYGPGRSIGSATPTLFCMDIPLYNTSSVWDDAGSTRHILEAGDDYLAAYDLSLNTILDEATLDYEFSSETPPGESEPTALYEKTNFPITIGNRLFIVESWYDISYENRSITMKEYDPLSMAEINPSIYIFNAVFIAISGNSLYYLERGVQGGQDGWKLWKKRMNSTSVASQVNFIYLNNSIKRLKLRELLAVNNSLVFAIEEEPLLAASGSSSRVYPRDIAFWSLPVNNLNGTPELAGIVHYYNVANLYPKRFSSDSNYIYVSENYGRVLLAPLERIRVRRVDLLAGQIGMIASLDVRETADGLCYEGAFVDSGGGEVMIAVVRQDSLGSQDKVIAEYGVVDEETLDLETTDSLNTPVKIQDRHTNAPIQFMMLED